MNSLKFLLFVFVLTCSLSIHSFAQDTFSTRTSFFDIKKDLLLAQFDCKTDVDDLHSVAGLATLLADSSFSHLKYHAVAGTYGIQDGLYVPPNDLFQLAFEDNWTDAHLNFEKAINKVKLLVINTINSGGDIWIAEAGQSDFTSALIKSIQAESDIIISKRIHVVQHSDWNESSTSPEKLAFVKEISDYYKIPDGNATGNGTPGFRSLEFKTESINIVKQNLQGIWELAVKLSNKYNGVDGRYNNEAISLGGLDFSDLSEVCWILELQEIKDVEEFFSTYSM